MNSPTEPASPNLSGSRKTLYLKAAVAGLVLVALVGASRFLPISQWLQQFTEWVKTHGTLGAVIFVAGFVIGTMLFVPASLFILAAGIAFGFSQGLPLAIISAMLGATIPFFVSRHFARKFVEKRLAQNARLKAFDSAVEKEGWKIVLLFRLTPILPFPVSNYFFGLTKINFWQYLFASTAGVMPATILYVYLGYAGAVVLGEKRHGRSTYSCVLLGLGLVATIALLFYLTRLAKRSLQQIEDRARQTQ
jgi:uncharacterized membrane protein YdjX (TVP38/TMEM64 family)